MGNKRRIVLTFVIGFGMWVVCGAISLLLIHVVPPMVKTKLHNQDVATLSYALIPMGVMALPFVLAMVGNETLNPFTGGSSRIESTVGAFKLMLLLCLALSGIGWIPLGYWTGKSLLGWLERRGIVQETPDPDI
jgi:hypothetical protein